MSDLKYCQGTRCHQHETKDRIKGTKGNKTYQTRRRSSFYYGNRAIDHFGRTTEPKHLTEDNAWTKEYNWDRNYENRTYYTYNRVTREQRPLTAQQYNDSNYTLNT